MRLATRARWRAGSGRRRGGSGRTCWYESVRARRRRAASPRRPRSSRRPPRCPCGSGCSGVSRTVRVTSGPVAGCAALEGPRCAHRRARADGPLRPREQPRRTGDHGRIHRLVEARTRRAWLAVTWSPFFGQGADHLGPRGRELEAVVGREGGAVERRGSGGHGTVNGIEPASAWSGVNTSPWLPTPTPPGPRHRLPVAEDLDRWHPRDVRRFGVVRRSVEKDRDGRLREIAHRTARPREDDREGRITARLLAGRPVRASPRWALAAS